MSVMNKRGQFFLIAALVIVGVLIGLSVVVNEVIVKEDKEYFYDISSEVGYETKRVMDFGEYRDGFESKELTSRFLFDYVNYIGQDPVIFIYGNSTDVSAFVFQEQDVGSIGLNTGEEKIIPIQKRKDGGKEANVLVKNGKVSIEIDSVNHEFEMNEGNNLFYIIMREENDEKLVAEG
ncbi:hypothetical protein COU60_03100 [Candidatus Pacearchaeota archaeon CG10_big_fil_rev_8_21_14_0_10_34_76]|nr:MAG: hypothetical protein COU60_03100 [Candidatus Pacearchaeota archaeon CG10_big_fil_rev_8_21_14_0_10_34_76]